MEGALVIGCGGRESAIMEAVKESSPHGLFNFDMNPNVEVGLANLSRLGVNNPLIVIGPEVPLVEGLADSLRDEGHCVLGVSKSAAQYEADKSKTVKLARKYGIVHPETFIAEGRNLLQRSLVYARSHSPEEYVIKANGLAGGKGVVLPHSQEQAELTIEKMVQGGYDGAGEEAILFAKRKKGPEVSAMVLVGGGSDNFMILPLAQDFKRLREDDMGPNTGGMGSYAPVPESIVSDSQYKAIEKKAHQLLEAMEKEGTPLNRGVMYMGLMLSEDLAEDETDLIEINVRLGDPETQVILPLLSSAGVNVYELLRSAAEGDLIRPNVDLRHIGKTALSVCLASPGYPDKALIGQFIHGLSKFEETDNIKVYNAGVKKVAEDIYITSGGRVLYITGIGEHIYEAARLAYSVIADRLIYFEGMQFRRDIGEKVSIT